MTVRENLDMGAYRRRDGGIREDLERVFDRFTLEGARRRESGNDVRRRAADAGDGPGAYCPAQATDAGRAFDGDRPILVQRIYETIAEINRQGVAILLVEQNANYALDVSERGYVLETGEVALTNELAQLRNDPAGAEGISGDMILVAVIGAKALDLLFAWLLSAAIGSWVSDERDMANGWAWLRADPVRDRIGVRAGAARTPGIEVEDRGLAPASAPPRGLVR